MASHLITVIVLKDTLTIQQYLDNHYFQYFNSQTNCYTAQNSRRKKTADIGKDQKHERETEEE